MRGRVDFFPPPEGLSAEQIRRGDLWLYADVKCAACGKDQPVAVLQNGRCVRCGEEA